MQPIQTSSGLISQFAYDEQQQVLHVHFRKGGHYLYNNVSAEKFNAFKESESHGKFFLTEIKPNHQFSKA